MAEAARRRVIISGFEVTSPFVILSRKTVGGEWLDWRAGNLSSEVKISPIQAAISGVWEDILLANVPRLNCDILNVEQLKFWNNTIQPWRGASVVMGNIFVFKSILQIKIAQQSSNLETNKQSHCEELTIEHKDQRLCGMWVLKYRS